ncbi:MAG TPA: CRISPR-associated helicase/endonuclease Cas3, partial [Planctomycetota bacterium]|nr:CRISPR-associated helicase/endonuclease Cas3 [Planctomycetota bacterium]
DVLRQLVSHFGATVVLSTATQPTSGRRELAWLDEARDLVPDPGRFFAELERVTWHLTGEPWGPERVGAELARSPQALAILNTRKEAMRVLAASPSDSHHLSTLMCPAHRRDVLARVRSDLQEGKQCRVVSTQVVEAGVDIDFPVVLRALGPLDSMIQAAGRCNREGRLDRGTVVVFEGGQLPSGFYCTATSVTKSLLGEGPVDLNDPEVAGRYFCSLYSNVNTDRERVQEARRRFGYEEVANRFRMIEDEGTPVVVRAFGQAADVIDSLDRRAELGTSRQVWRDLQPYTVNLRRAELELSRGRGWLSEGGVLTVWTGPYDERFGVGAVLMEEMDASPTA